MNRAAILISAQTMQQQDKKRQSGLATRQVAAEDRLDRRTLEEKKAQSDK